MNQIFHFLHDGMLDYYHDNMVSPNRIQEISDAANYIETRLEQPLLISQIAANVGLSAFHFQRLFFQALGENVSDYIRRRRLERGANLLLTKRDVTVIDIALETGFESHSAFSRAFKDHYGHSPTRFRQKAKLSDSPDKRPFLISTKTEPLDLLPDLMELPELWFIYRKQQGMKNGSYFPEQHDLAKAFSELEAAVSRTDRQGFWANCGAYRGGPSAFSDVAAIGCYGGLFAQQPSLDWSPNCENIDSGKWAVFSHYGAFDYLHLTWNKVARNWLPRSGYQLRDTWAFETYLERPGNMGPHKASALIYLPIK